MTDIRLSGDGGVVYTVAWENASSDNRYACELSETFTEDYV